MDHGGIGEDEQSAEFGDAKGRRKTENLECIYSTLAQQGNTGFCRGIFFGGWGPGLEILFCFHDHEYVTKPLQDSVFSYSGSWKIYSGVV